MDLVKSTFLVKESAPVLEAIFKLHFPKAETVLDATYGHGRFWLWDYKFKLTGTDIDPDRAKDAVCSFEQLTFTDKSFDVVVLDPPFFEKQAHWQESKRGVEYGTNLNYDNKCNGTIDTYMNGISEAFRVCKSGIIVKCKDMIYSGKSVWIHNIIMNKVAQKFGIFPYDKAIQIFDGTLITSPTWKTQHHFRRQESYYLIYKI